MDNPKQHYGKKLLVIDCYEKRAVGKIGTIIGHQNNPHHGTVFHVDFKNNLDGFCHTLNGQIDHRHGLFIYSEDFEFRILENGPEFNDDEYESMLI